ncbi:hypothetical protein CFC21_073986 [Triticum aestivum]|uniref:Uncharacterized protein n=3 Tax=Triticum TaxID=4564 RepID=A0A9R0XK74_TRITD|nr:uncharacterized protein LOC123113677 [Triticum aestivum]KAF7068211.1 hypothetical protein CFC21_073986 [Triticum aestivum]VAI38024.1 unnamed protein product [Triticum turgidum subsp. durum]
MPFQLKAGHHHGAMDGKPPPPPPLAPAPTPRVSRLRRLLVRVSASERLAVAGDGKEKEREERPAAGGEAEVGSVGLDRMVLSFMEDSAAVERPPRGRCNCFNGSNYEESDDEEGFFLPSGQASAPPPSAAGDTLEALKSLVQSASVAERNLLADASRIAERCGRTCKGKAECRRAVADGLRALGYDAAVCKSRWEKTPSYPAGEHEYIDAVVGDGARLIVEVHFRSEFEVARSTKAYRAALQALPPLFVGTSDRLGKIVSVVAEAARQSMKKKGLHFPPWRKPEYMRAKWLSPHVRTGDKAAAPSPAASATATAVSAASFSGEFELLFGMNKSGVSPTPGEKITVVVSPWRPTEEAASKKQQPRAKVVTGLAAVL